MTDAAAPPTDQARPEADCRPQVALPSSGMPIWALAAMAGAFGLAIMLSFHGRGSPHSDPASDRIMAARTIAALPPALDRAPGDVLGIDRSPATDRPPAFARIERPAYIARLEPTDAAPGGTGWRGNTGHATGGVNSEGGGRVAFRTEPMPGAPIPGRAAGGQFGGTGGSSVVYDAGTSDDAKSAADATARASLIRNRPAVVAQGEILPATLETPVNSLRPGMIRAIVSRDVRGFDGSQVLIPRGSRLIGDYRPDPQSGRRRILATWTRLIRPDGVAIRIDSPAAASDGSTGLPGKVDTHFLARFANATLQTALQVGVNLASRAGNGSVIVSNTPQSAVGAMGRTIIPGADDPPTVSVKAGAAIAVFVARDLDFSGVPVAP